MLTNFYIVAEISARSHYQLSLLGNYHLRHSEILAKMEVNTCDVLQAVV